MKYIIIVFIALNFFETSAQEQILIENTWYLEGLFIDGEVSYPPSNSEVLFVGLNFTQPNTLYTLTTGVCNSIQGEVLFNGWEFSFNTWSMTLGTCIETENQDFEMLYATFYANNPLGVMFSYDAVELLSGAKSLTITNSSGNKALYGNEDLSIQEFLSNGLSIHPNPVESELFISTTTQLNDVNVKIFDINGKLILSLKNEMDLNSKSLDVQKLTKGIYFMLLEDKQGRRSVIKKFIKN